MEIIPLEHARLSRELDKKHAQNEKLLVQCEMQHRVLDDLGNQLATRDVVISIQARKLSFWRWAFVMLITLDAIRVWYGH